MKPIPIRPTSSERMEPVPVPDIRLLDAGQPAGRMHPATNRLLFVMTGSLRLAAGAEPPLSLEAGQLVFLPEETETVLEPEPDTVVVVLCFTDDTLPDDDAGSGFPDPAKTDPKTAGAVDVLSETAVFPIRPPLYEFLSDFCRHRPAIRRDPAFRQLKSRELFFWLRRSYRSDELKRLFLPVLKRKNDFRYRVTRYASGSRSVAQLARTLACSPSTLNRFFHRTFGMPVYQWMQRQKARHVQALLAQGDLPLETIRKSCGFTSAAHLTKFCKKHLGAPPSIVRKQAARKNRSLRSPGREKAFPETLPREKKGRISCPGSSDTG